MRLHTITIMRDQLLALQEIDVALSKGDFDNASHIAEQRLGMSSLELHGAAHIASYMPQGMYRIAFGCPGACSTSSTVLQDAARDHGER